MSDDGYNQLFAHLAGGKRHGAKSVEQMPESREMQVVDAVSTGSLPVIEAEALLRIWDNRAKQARKRYRSEGGWVADKIAAGATEQCAQDLRLLMGLTNERQPEENHPLNGADTMESAAKEYFKE